MAGTYKRQSKKAVETILHDESTRTYIPTVEYESVMPEEDKSPIQVAYQRRNRDLDPQLVWRGKDLLNWSDLVVQAPPLYIQEKVHPKVLIDDLMQQTEKQKQKGVPRQLDLFADFNGLPDEAAKTEFYQHEANWSNRMILGDSLQVMASLAEREGLRGKVQCIYIDPPYGIKFNSNFQWSTTSRDVKDGKYDHITREPEQVKAFRDTWREGIHSYLTYLRDRLTIARDLLTDSGSIFIQIGDENIHRVRSLLDEIFGDENFISQITYRTSGPLKSTGLAGICDFILWYAKNNEYIKYRDIFRDRDIGEGSVYTSVDDIESLTRRKMDSEERRRPQAIMQNFRIYCTENLVSSGYTPTCTFDIKFEGRVFSPTSNKSWKTNRSGIDRLVKARRVDASGRTIRYILYFDDYPMMKQTNLWHDMKGESDKTYVVQTSSKIIERCVLMTTDPGDLVLDPTCGSGTTAYISEQWGRRWITVDTSRVALALARARIMGARFPYFLLSDSYDGQKKEAEIGRIIPSKTPTFERIKLGFVYQRAPHITIKSIANNIEIDIIWEKWHYVVKQALKEINKELRNRPTPFKIQEGGRVGYKLDFTAPDGKTVKMPSGETAPANGFMEWEVPRKAPKDWPPAAVRALEDFWKARIGRQQEIDASIAAKADYEYLYDQPYVDNKKVRVAGPFTVESLSPHRVLAVDQDDELIDPLDAPGGPGSESSFVEMILENLRTAGVQQAHKEDRIKFLSLKPWPGEYICAEGRYLEGGKESGRERRAGVFIGPEFGTVSRADLVAAAREAGDAAFDVLVACAFSYDARSTEFDKLGRLPVLKARMNADLHMAEDLKNTGQGNLFVIFGEPDIELIHTKDNQIQVKLNGVDVFDPRTGEIRSDNADGIACWFVDTNYNEESFFVRQAYFLGANDPYRSLKTTLKAEINRQAWASLHSDISRPFDRPETGRIAVKVINHLGDEVMKVFRI